MALNLNKVILAGRVATEPEIKQTQTGVSVCNFRLAVNRRVSGGEHPESDFFNVTAWQNTAEFIGKYFPKGSAICICGRIQNRTYADKDGINRTVTCIIAEEASFVESRASATVQPDLTPKTVEQTPNAPNFEVIKGDDDLPF